MHYHCEIIMPPTDDVESSVGQILAPFDENNEESLHAFWDFWIIGGRSSGAKLIAGLNQQKLESFSDELKRRKVTVSGLQCGKQELSPASQIPMVDALWKDYFPDYLGKHCPLFNHYNDQYKNSPDWPDVMPFGETPPELTCDRLIFASQSTKASAMFSREIWNGVNHEKTVWDGTLDGGLSLLKERLEYMADAYREAATPADGWLTVTVDYHS